MHAGGSGNVRFCVRVNDESRQLQRSRVTGGGMDGRAW